MLKRIFPFGLVIAATVFAVGLVPAENPAPNESLKNPFENRLVIIKLLQGGNERLVDCSIADIGGEAFLIGQNVQVVAKPAGKNQFARDGGEIYVRLDQVGVAVSYEISTLEEVDYPITKPKQEVFGSGL